jgi:hypothetical protein
MNRKRLKFLTTTFCMLSFVMAQAQTTVNATGGNASGTSGSASYSIGQLVYTTNASSSGSVAQGVQHAYEVFLVGSTNVYNLKVSVYPNPTADMLVLQLGNYTQGAYSYVLHDSQGKLVLSGSIQTQQTFIDTKLLPTAAYFLSIINNKKEKIETFKIIKNQ